jgi:hypothetical protein
VHFYNSAIAVQCARYVVLIVNPVPTISPNPASLARIATIDDPAFTPPVVDTKLIEPVSLYICTVGTLLMTTGNLLTTDTNLVVSPAYAELIPIFVFVPGAVKD